MYCRSFMFCFGETDRASKPTLASVSLAAWISARATMSRFRRGVRLGLARVASLTAEQRMPVPITRNSHGRLSSSLSSPSLSPIRRRTASQGRSYCTDDMRRGWSSDASPPMLQGPEAGCSGSPAPRRGRRDAAGARARVLPSSRRSVPGPSCPPGDQSALDHRDELCLLTRATQLKFNASDWITSDISARQRVSRHHGVESTYSRWPELIAR